MDSFDVQTRQRNTLVDVTAQVRDSLRRSGLEEGLGVVYCLHTTAAITINEGYDPDVVHDMLLWLERQVSPSPALPAKRKSRNHHGLRLFSCK